MAVVIQTDMEGVSGCVGGGYGRGLDAEMRRQYFDLMLGEINAVVDGCARAGVDEIIVCEAHPVDLARLHKAAKLARGVRHSALLARKRFDAALFVGQHARTGLAHAVRSHTGSSNSIIGFWINGRPAGELGYVGGLLGAHGVPVIFLSGDTAACREAEEWVEGIVTVAVEESFSVHGAVCLPPGRTHPILTDGVAEAFRRRDRIRPIVFDTPVTFKIEFKYAAIADDYCVVPGTKREDARTVSFTAPTYEEAYRGGVAVLGSILARYDAPL